MPTKTGASCQQEGCGGFARVSDSGSWSAKYLYELKIRPLSISLEMHPALNPKPHGPWWFVWVCRGLG